MNKSLAIVIPAYKIDFFRDTLDSFDKQTCKNFTVYVGDDCSTGDFASLINEYRNKIDIVYHRFDYNLGGRDLVGQWERCISLTQNEKWIWLFSDDDMLDSRCVELFYREVEKTQFDIYHFDVKIINENSQIVTTPKPYPEVISSLDLYKRKCASKIESFVVENIFSREIYDRIGRFKNFELAWGSDLATWVLMSSNKGLKKISGANVQWRKSSFNITPNMSKNIVIRKLSVDIQFIAWANAYFDTVDIKMFNQYYLLRLLIHYSLNLSKKDFNDILLEAGRKGIIGNEYRIVANFSRPFIRFIKFLKSRKYE